MSTVKLAIPICPKIERKRYVTAIRLKNGVFIKDSFELESNCNKDTINKSNMSNSLGDLIKSNTKMKHCEMMLKITISSRKLEFQGRIHW